MADTSGAKRLEPVLDPAARPPASQADLRAAVDQAAVDQAAIAPPAPYQGASERLPVEQLARIEEKAARIEDKFARQEALMLRLEAKLEAATSRTEEAARVMQGEVQSVSRRLRLLPGFGSLMVMGIVVALLSAAIVLFGLRYGVPGLLPPPRP